LSSADSFFYGTCDDCCVAVDDAENADINATKACPACSAPLIDSPRIRREVRSLSSEEWQRVVDAFWVMKLTSTADGQQTYGAAFKNYDYFVARHVVAAADERGDQAHFGPHFMTWHAAFVLEFERALLAVDERIEALPYWDAADTETSVFTDDLLGSAPGTGPGYTVEDGAFADWSIPVDYEFPDFVETTNTGNAEGFLRGVDNTLNTSTVARLDSASNLPSWATLPSADDFWRCANIDAYWPQWYACIEAGSVNNVTMAATSIHSGPHLDVGGKDAAFAGVFGTAGGDFEDPLSSPNDPLFMFHHANMDRNNRRFLTKADADGKGARYYGFPVENAVTIFPFGIISGAANFYGQHLNDVMSDEWPFTAEDLGFAGLADDAEVTHADVLCWNAPDTSQYTYDELGDDGDNGDDATDGTQRAGDSTAIVIVAICVAVSSFMVDI